MKRTFLLLLSFLLFTCILGNSSQFTSTKDVLSSDDTNESYEIPPSSNYYFSLGTSAIYQNIGIGIRSRDLSKNRGNDFSFNVKFTPILLKIDYFFLIPSIQYLRLYYSGFASDAKYSNYFGAGLEILGLRAGHENYPIINPKVTWGREYTSGRFSQFSINLTPATLVACSLLDFKKLKSCHISTAIALASLACMFEYSFGF
ncbi:hypothetical protein COB11_05150 [Candidatus Aerophobetes bacterium]|uniref:Outer membrane protein beta-barrel domain-containing protein n=1 Tax=Aerophobetes bacterium TaxID=2030807 RepID=A0A2A4YFZ6_UNCAE|nr:MAG: hypothetical protein COB11_05150 [Candidatus Aerophobetes bacterium]